VQSLVLIGHKTDKEIKRPTITEGRRFPDTEPPSSSDPSPHRGLSPIVLKRIRISSATFERSKKNYREGDRRTKNRIKKG